MFINNLKALVQRLLVFVDNVISSFGKFGKSSYLSLLFLGIILLLVQAMEQANTLLVDMIEHDKVSLICCFILISVFASVLSHYPRYIYYAENINDSRDDHQWYAYKWLGYTIFIFSKIDRAYKQDYKAKFFRHCLGLIIFIIWHYYIYQTFYPKLIFGDYKIEFFQTMSLLFTVIPAIILIVLLDRFDNYQDRIINGEDDDEEVIKAKDEKKKFVTLGVTALLLSMGIVIVFAVLLIVSLKFNFTGYWLLQIFTFLLALMYILFRVFRVQVITVYYKLHDLSSSVGYLRYYFVFAVVVALFLIYSNLAVYFNWKLSNAMLILLGYLFIFYYIVACLVKYYFMLSIFDTQKKDLEANPHVTPKSYLYTSGVKKENRHHLVPLTEQKAFSQRRRLVASVITMVVIVLGIISLNSESAIHELKVYEKAQNEEVMDMKAFKMRLRERTQKPLFFVASHGGGLKANIWTMKVLNEIQMKTEGEFLNQTISFSGASGGMMGLSLYSVLSGEYTGDFNAIGAKIDEVATENFASKDLALTFGFDGFRKLFPFNKLGKYRDRSYYAMVTYRNILENETGRTLDSLSFNAYWKTNIFDNKNQYFPSLIINTAKTNGRRGVFYSVKYPKDSTLFYNSDNLSQLHNGAIAFYEAVSSTNRFPALSPAAKIKNYGHYIDAGAIDNSGLLSSIDLHNYLLKDSTLNTTKKVFVEIINGRNNYIWHLIQKFKKEKDVDHFFIEEKEQDNIVADLKTGLNLDKIPNYLSDFLNDWSKNPLVSYIPIYLPFQIELKEVEAYLGGKLIDSDQIIELNYFLDRQNAKVKKQINDNGSVWQTYEPTLARHLSKSTIAYYDRVIQSELITDQIEEITAELKTKTHRP
ncbi:DUF443 domain-containing protein [Gelidibacter maritimus]|uniref:Patatin-like phospholipase n=1 Tax=Gelidibacter maritimus TaxID=2761487 RepID=A0A7W2M4H5_9FLAO|nr:hypothetical protein [Gelidibacter maritimus]MBA6152462.1 hypothetical protein [Gelidibacter maritimus]